MNITYITGNPEKAKRFSAALGIELKHQAIDVPEIQSLSIDEVVEAKARSAFAIVGTPVVVEDTALVIESLGKLPGPFIKFFLDSMSLENICNMVAKDDRTAYSEVAFAYFDGTKCQIVKNRVPGTIAESPRGENGFGWDAIFIPDGLGMTAAELSPEKYEEYYPTHFKPFAQLRELLASLN